MKRALAVCVIVLLTVVPAAYSADGDDKTPARILVTFADPAMSNAARAGPPRPGYSRRSGGYLVSVKVKRAANRIARDFGLLVLDEWPILPLKVHCLVFAVPEDASADDVLTRLRDRAEVESAQLLNEFEVSASLGTTAPDPYSGLQHNMATLELAQAHAWSVGDGTTVTIVDTGADFTHPDLKGQVTSHQDFVDAKTGVFTADAHGTAVAGIIGASANNGVGLVGIAPSTRLRLLKACWYTAGRSQAVCDSFTLAKALSYAVAADTDVINLSLAGPSDALLSRLVNVALQRGIVVVAAAPAEHQMGFPAEIAGVIVVRAQGPISSRDELQRFPVTAPGQEILVPVPGGGYDYASGSSLSAAHVSGIVALLFSKRPGLSHADVQALLIDSRGNNDGSVNACRALARLLQRSGCRTRPVLTHAPGIEIQKAADRLITSRESADQDRPKPSGVSLSYQRRSSVSQENRVDAPRSPYR